MFDKFDTDNSGALDPNELVQLFRKNSVFVNRDMIFDMYGEGILLTFEEFLKINSSPEALKKFRTGLKKNYYTLSGKYAADFKTNKMPKTFDGLMVEFGVSCSRKIIYDELEEIMSEMLK